MLRQLPGLLRLPRKICFAGPFYQRRKRYDKRADKKVRGAVDHVKGQARDDPGYGSLEIEVKHNSLRRGPHCPEQIPVRRADDHVSNRKKHYFFCVLFLINIIRHEF